MAKKGKEATEPDAKAAAIRSLFSADSPFRRKEGPPEEPAPPAAPAPDTPVRKLSKPKLPVVEAEAEPAESSRKKRKEEEEGAPPRRKRKRDEVEAGYERRRLGTAAPAEETAPRQVVGKKRKAPGDVAVAAAGGAGEEGNEESFDDEGKLLRTVFVGNLPLRTKKKALAKEFAAFGEVESVRIRSVPLGDTKIPRKGAVIKGKINDSVDNVHAYIVFKDEQCARAALSHNMALFNGNHMRVDMACPPRKKLRGEGPLYDRKRTVFDEELYQLFCGPSGPQGDVEAIRVVRDPDSSLGKGIAYVLFKTREAANGVVRKRSLKIRDDFLSLTHAKAADATPKKMECWETHGGPRSFTPGSKSVKAATATNTRCQQVCLTRA